MWHTHACIQARCCVMSCTIIKKKDSEIMRSVNQNINENINENINANATENTAERSAKQRIYRKAKRYLFFFLACIILLSLVGCEKKVTTLNAVTGEDDEISYIEIKELKLKEEVLDNGREDVQYCAVVIPEGYVESEDVPGMYVHEKAPLDSSNIYYSVSDGVYDGYVSENLTQEEYESILTQALSAQEDTGSVTVESFEEVDIDDVTAFKIRSTYEADGYTVQQLTYLILAEDTYTITYSQADDDELLADFEVSDGQIKLVKKNA